MAAVTSNIPRAAPLHRVTIPMERVERRRKQPTRRRPGLLCRRKTLPLSKQFGKIRMVEYVTRLMDASILFSRTTIVAGELRSLFLKPPVESERKFTE